LPAADQVKRAALPKQPIRQCPKCESTKIIPNAMIREQSSDGALKIMVDANPDALIFKNREYSTLFANICGECGHVELKAEDYRKLYIHYLQSNR
jgi:hypothetical protein